MPNISSKQAYLDIFGFNIPTMNESTCVNSQIY